MKDLLLINLLGAIIFLSSGHDESTKVLLVKLAWIAYATILPIVIVLSIECNCCEKTEK